MSISELEISNGLCLDVEDNKPDSNHSQISINNLKANVIIGNKTLVLVGTIAFEKPIGKNTLRHYVAYCRNLQGCWKKYDDASRYDRPVKIKNIVINVALLIYVVYELSTNKHSEKLKLEKIEPNIKETEFNQIPSQSLDHNERESTNNDLSIDYEVIQNSSMIPVEEIRKSDISQDLPMSEEESESFTKRRWIDESSNSSQSQLYSIHNNAEERNLLQNGLILPPIQTSFERIKLKNTCPIDLIFEILTAAYCFSNAFRRILMKKVMMEENGGIFDLLRNYINTFSRNRYYTERAAYCKTLYDLVTEREYNLIDCKDNVISFFEKLMGESYSVHKKTNCNNCDYQNFKKFKIQLINTDLIQNDESLYNLESLLRSIFVLQKKMLQL